MARYPDALQKIIPAGSNDPAIKAIGMVLHVSAGLGDSLHDFFSGPSGGIESHFYIRRTGVVEQYRDTAFEADANLNGNSFERDGRLCGLLSVETEGLGDGSWTDEQLRSLKALMAWVMQVHDVPAQVCPAWNAPGFGYHVMFGAPGPWTPVAKSCPGPHRIDQFKTILVPWLHAGGHNPTEEDDDMQLSDRLGSADDAPTVRQALRAAIHVDAAFAAYRKNAAERDKALADGLDQLIDQVGDAATKAQIQRLRDLIKEDPAPPEVP